MTPKAAAGQGRPRSAPWVGAALALLFLACAPPSSCDLDQPEAWADRWAAVAARGRGFVVWESNRSGAWRIWYRALDGSGLRQLSPDESDRDHFAPHVSPDGSRIAYLSFPRPHNSYEIVSPKVQVPLHILHVEAGENRIVVPNARSTGESRAVTWIDNDHLIHLDGNGHARELDLRTGRSVALTPNNKDHVGYLLNPGKTHASRDEAAFCVYRSPQEPIVMRQRREGCQPYFSRDGRWGFWTSGSGGPIRRIDLATGRMGVILDRDDPRQPPGWGYVYFPMVSPDQRLLAFGASRGEHDHFQSDYEIFIAPVDPKTLDLVAEPVRYTFHPSTDRFPDVFLAGLELGHHKGEAPFPLRLDPRGVRTVAGEGVWDWDFGDGTRMAAEVGEHTYRVPGHYRVTARRGSTSIGADVVVDAPAPPEPIHVVVGARDREIDVYFDEPISAGTASLRLDSGAAIRGWRDGPDGRSLHIELSEMLADSDVLRIGGVLDRAAEPNVMPERSLHLRPSGWPSRREGLLWAFRTGADDNLVRDPRTGEERGYNLKARGRARFDHAHAMQLSGGYFDVEGLPDTLLASCQKSGEFGIEMLIRAKDRDLDEPGRIVTVMSAEGDPFFSLEQMGRSLRVRLKTSEITLRSGPRFGVGRIPASGPVHLVVTYRPGRLVSYLNGHRVADTDELSEDLGNWGNPGEVRFGSKPEMGMQWRGALEGVALYCRFLDREEAASNARNALERLEERDEVQRLHVRARLLERSVFPTLEQITPYREALVLNEYEVLEVLDGKLGEQRIRVAHFAILDGENQPIASLPLGGRIVLDLEPLNRNEQVASLYQSDTLPLNLDLPLFLDIGS